MGQFLAIGLTTKLSVNKTEIEKTQLSIEQLQKKMMQELNYVPEIYVVSEHEDIYDFHLNERVFHSQLIPFLNEVYPLLYDKPISYDNVLKKLYTLPPSSWQQLAEMKSEYAFQFDTDGMCDCIRENNSRILINYESLLLSMEGKILMEEFGRQFNFFKYTMMQAFHNYSLAGALRIYITG